MGSGIYGTGSLVNQVEGYEKSSVLISVLVLGEKRLPSLPTNRIIRSIPCSFYTSRPGSFPYMKHREPPFSPRRIPPRRKGGDENPIMVSLHGHCQRIDAAALGLCRTLCALLMRERRLHAKAFNLSPVFVCVEKRGRSIQMLIPLSV